MLKDGTLRGADYVIRVHGSLEEIGLTCWDKLVSTRAARTPFVHSKYLQALHDTGCAAPATGWQPLVFALYQEETLKAACLVYLKTHSYGEYVFDWSWADAYERHGLPYYPKLTATVPFTPVTGPHLLGGNRSARVALLKGVESFSRQQRLSSAHFLYLDDEDREAAEAAGWLMRKTVQFHWANRALEPYRDFTDFLASMHRDKRKKIQQERRRVQDAGIHFTVAQGRDIDTQAWDYFYLCYTTTYREHRSTPYLSRAFFTQMAQALPDNWVLFTAHQGTERVATSLICIDDTRQVAFGRYWGCTAAVSCLHFEACYYQPLAWCIANGLQRFEGGAQGEHKLARGLMPVVSWSAHWLAHPQFAGAISDHLEQESEWVAEHVRALQAHQPFKAPPAPAFQAPEDLV